MKIKALAALCAEAKELTLYDAADGSQWAGTSAVRYKLPESLGELSTNALCAIMDFGPDKLAKMRVNREPMTETINTDDDAVGQKDLLYWLDRRLILDGRDVLPLIAPGGEIVCIQTQYLRPGKDAEQPALVLRRTDAGTPYVVFMDGLFAVGVIAPMHPAPELVTWLSDVLGGVTVNDG